MKRINLHLAILTTFCAQVLFSCGEKKSVEQDKKQRTRLEEPRKWASKVDSIVALHNTEDNIETPYLRHVLYDMNFDNHQDLVIYVEGMGTGMLELARVFTYDSLKKDYEFDYALENPTFYWKKKMITCFYIGKGAGDARRLEWDGKRWNKTGVVTFEAADSDEPKWLMTVENKKTGKITSKTIELSFAPPGYIIEGKY